MMPLLSDPALALYAVRCIAATGVLIATSEQLRNWRDFTDTGLMSWAVMRRKLAHPSLRAVVAFGDAVLSAPAFFWVLAFRAACAATLLVPHLPVPVEVTALAAIVVTNLLVSFRVIFGQDGSDQMFRLLFVALLLVSLVPGDARVQDAGLWFIALQACLAYFTAGVGKAFGKDWRGGGAVFLIFNTRSYGTRPVAAVLAQQPVLTRLLSWSVIATELLFPLALVGGPGVAFVFFAWGFVFHVLNALVMGLNPFFFAFVATYPAILYCCERWAATH